MNRRSVLLRLSERIYRLCLLAFPVDFRRKQGEETVRFFRDRARRAVRERGLGALPGLWLRAYPDALVQGLAERFCSGRRASPEVFGTELRQTVRGLVRSPSFSLPVVSTLALGLGATGVVVALARGVFLHPLPFPADDLLFVGQRFGGQQAIMTSPLALERLEEQSVVEEVAHFRTFVTTVTGVGDPIRYRQAIVSHDYFDVLGVAPALGREFEADEEGPSGPRLVIVSHAVWTTRLGADPDVLGRSVDLDGVPHRIIGVMPADFRGPTGYLTFGDDAIQLWVTSASDDVARGAGFLVVRGLTRPASGATLEAVRTAAAAVGRTLAEEMGEDDVVDLTAVPFRERVVKGGRTALLILAVAAGLVLLVGCANVTNLVLARSLARQDDLTVRRALGAGRTDLVRHTALETVVLGVVGGLLGLAIAHLGLRGLLSVAPPFPFRYAIRVEPLTVGVSLALALAVALLAGLLAALRTVGGRAALTPSASRTASQTTGSWRLRKVFAVSQVTLAAGLLVGAMLLARSFQALLDVERGYSAEGVRVAHLTLPTVRYASAEERRATLKTIAERLAGRPEVEAVGYATAVPHMGINDRGTSVALADGLVRREEAEAWADFRGVTPGYLRVLGMELLLGRMLEEEDLVDGRPTAALVNRTFADRFLEDGRILRRRIALDGFEDLEVVGVVRDV
ncbi:MAG TPA: ABC transporter permease, partial [Longimicrobiales bacterium]|nr:ABC transporter permease [Longimicrobiales bacterium]